MEVAQEVLPIVVSSCRHPVSRFHSFQSKGQRTTNHDLPSTNGQSFATTENVRLKVSITNPSRNDLGFGTCPNPYEVEVSDQQGNVIPPKPEVIRDPSGDADGKATQIVGLPLCMHDFSSGIKPGDTWTEEIALPARADLTLARIYAVQTVLEILNEYQDCGDRASSKTLRVPSSRTNITIAE